MFDWIRKKFISEGKVIIGWPAKDLREDKIITDLSKLDQDLVGIRRRRYGVYGRTEPPPEFEENVEFIPIRNLWKTEFIEPDQ